MIYFARHLLRNNSMSKRLVYILNKVDADDSQHYVHVMRLMQHLQRLGWEVVILSEKGGRGTQNIQGCEVRYLSVNGGPIRILRQLWQMVILRLSGHRLIFVRITRPAALIVAALGPMMGYRSLYWLSGMVLDFDDRSKWASRLIQKKITAFIVSRFDRFVTGPETMVKYYQDNMSVPESKITMLYNDVAVPNEFRAPNWTIDIPLSILMVHRLSPVRRTDLYFGHILEAIELATSKGIAIRLDVVGDGPERELLQRTADIEYPNIEVVFHGAIANNKLSQYYADAHIFLMPSYREGFPRVMLEAMSYGLPIVSTDAGGVSDIVGEEQRKFVAGRDDPARFARLLTRLITDLDARDSLSRENSLRVRKYSTANVAISYDEALSDVLLSKRHKR